MNFENPLIVQSDKTLLLDVHAPLAEECRNDLIPFAELEKYARYDVPQSVVMWIKEIES